LFKTNAQRFDDAITIIRTHFGNDAATLTKRYVDGYPNRDGLGKALHLDGREDSSSQETERRNHLRAVLLLAHAVGGLPLSQTSFLTQRFGTQATAALRNEIGSRLPLFDYSPLRSLWNPMNFTQAQDPPPSDFRYIVFGMMNTHTGRGVSYKDILSDPNKLKSFMLSTSLIDQAHLATYYPYGFILTVPEENILSTLAQDQAFKNYKADTGAMTLAELMDMREEVRRVAAAYPLLSPDQILAPVARPRRPHPRPGRRYRVQRNRSTGDVTHRRRDPDRRHVHEGRFQGAAV
jgi:hypothetical protein